MMQVLGCSWRLLQKRTISRSGQLDSIGTRMPWVGFSPKLTLPKSGLGSRRANMRQAGPEVQLRAKAVFERSNDYLIDISFSTPPSIARKFFICYILFHRRTAYLKSTTGL